MDLSDTSMKVAVYYKNDDVRVEERPIPEIGPGEILVQTQACGLCGGETMEWYLASRAPKVLGHEPTGVVVAVGKGVVDFQEGDRVFAHHHVGCMSCHLCNRGLYTMCSHYSSNNLDPGGMAEYFRVPAENTALDTLHLPDEVSFEAGTVIEPMACTMRGIKLSNLHDGDTVAIIGAGFMGMCYLQLLRITAVGKIIVLDLNEWRMETALSQGANHVLHPQKGNPIETFQKMNDGRLADAVFVTAPTLPAWELGLALCEKGASLHFGAPPPPATIWQVDPTNLYFREIRINSTYSASHIETRAVLDLLASKRVDADSLITHRFGLHQVADAIAVHLEAEQSLKSVILPRLTS